MVVAGHKKTAQAAQRILREGGNAFDAIVAAGFAACVAEPVLTSLGGGGFLLAHNAEGLECLYDFFVQTPKNRPDPKSLDFYPIDADFGSTTQEFHIGLGSVATPGTVAGFFKVHQDLGSLPIQEVMAPAIDLCREGLKISRFQEYLFSVVQPIYSATPESRKIFSNGSGGDKLVQEGDTLKFLDLANTLEALMKEGKDLFYQGELARQMVEQCKKGGVLHLKDLRSYQVYQRKPFDFKYQGHRILTNPPPSCGGILIAFTLELLEKIKSASGGFGEISDLMILAHAMELTNKARIDALSQEDRWEDVPRILFNPKFLDKYRQQITGRPAVLRGTTHINVIDSQGNVASMSLSNGEGCGEVLHGTGIMLNNMLGEEDLNPEGFHSWPKDIRMASMMSPTLMFMSDGFMVATGSGGSNRIRTAIVQVLRNLMDFQFSISEAVKSPRIHFERGLLSVEPGFSLKVVERLCEEFPQNHLWEEKNLFFGGVHTVGLHPRKGFSGVGDPRRSGVCLKV